MSGEGMIANDPARFVRWEPTLDPRTRPFHDLVPAITNPPWDIEPPRNLGRFNCRGEYVVPWDSRLADLVRSHEPKRGQWPLDVTVPPAVMRGRIVIHQPTPPELPEGLWDRDGVLFFECRGCERAVQLECDPEEFHPDVAYCGGSPRCLP